MHGTVRSSALTLARSAITGTTNCAAEIRELRDQSAHVDDTRDNSFGCQLYPTVQIHFLSMNTRLLVSLGELG